MNTPEDNDAAQDALRMALEIKMLREQLLLAIGEARTARAAAGSPPAVAAPTPPSTPKEVVPFSPPKPAARPSDHHVLCVEDSAANFQLIENILTDRPGTQLTWAESGRKGVELAKEKTPELVLLDLDLSDMHGSEVPGHLRKNPATAETPVIVISADATPSQIEHMLAAGARDYITKPCEIRWFLLMFNVIFPQSAAS